MTRGPLHRMLEDQAAFNQQIFKKGSEEKPTLERLRSLVLGAVEESLEFIRTFDYKVHRRSKLRLQNVAHSHEELVDIFKYWLSLVDLTDFPLDRLEEMYYAKSRVVRYRYQEEWQKQVTGKCVIVDIDQVLADYITGICNWAKEYGTMLMGLSPSRTRSVMDRLDQLKANRTWISAETVGVTHLEWQAVKHDFRTHGGKRLLPVFKDAKPFLEWCHQNEWLIVLMTSRPVNEYPNIFTDTLTWLHNNELPFDYLWWAAEKGERIEEESHVMLRSQIVFAVDDSARFVDQFRSKGIPTYHLDRTLPFDGFDPTQVGNEMKVRTLHDLMTRYEHAQLVNR